MAASLDTSDSKSYSKGSVVRGHHTYKSIWTPFNEESIAVSHKIDNAHVSHAVTVFLDDCVFRHLPGFTAIDSTKQLLTINPAISYCFE